MGPKPVAQEVPRVMANMLAPSSASPLPAGTMGGNGVPTFPAPLLALLSCSSPFVLLGKVGEAKSWQLPTRKTPVCKEAVPNKSQRSMEAEAGPSTSSPRLEDPCLPVLYPRKHLPHSTSPSRACSLSTLLWHFPHDHECLQKPEGNRGSSLPQFFFFHPAKSFKLFCILIIHTPVLCPTFRLESFRFLPSNWQDEGFFFLNIPFNKTYMEYAQLCQWSGKYALSFFQRTRTFPLSFHNYFWSRWFHFVSPADTNQMREMIWGWIFVLEGAEEKNSNKILVISHFIVKTCHGYLHILAVKETEL